MIIINKKEWLLEEKKTDFGIKSSNKGCHAVKPTNHNCSIWNITFDRKQAVTAFDVVRVHVRVLLAA